MLIFVTHCIQVTNGGSLEAFGMKEGDLLETSDLFVPTGLQTSMPNVLVLEDEDLMSALILKYLNRVSDSLPQALRIQSQPSGWDLLTKDLSHIKVAVVDILLPNVTGIDLIRDFRKRYPHMGIVPISGLATEPMKRSLKEILPVEARLLPKPLRKEDFLEAFLSAWNSKQPPQTAPSPAQEAGEEQVWSAVQGNPTNNVSIERRRLPRRKAA